MNIHSKKISWIVLILFMYLYPAYNAAAPGSYKLFQVNLGIYYADMSTTIRLDADKYDLGTKFVIEDELGLADNQSSPYIDMILRFANRHQLNFSYYNLRRSGTKILENEIKFGDKTFDFDLTVDSFFNTEIYRLSYGYSFLKDEKREFGILAGFHLTNIDTGIKAAIKNTEAELDESVEQLAPLPSVGLFGQYRFTQHWYFYGWMQVFSLSYDAYDGYLLNSSALINYAFNRNVGLGLGYSLFNFNIEADNGKLTGDFDYDFRGPVLTLNFGF